MDGVCDLYKLRSFFSFFQREGLTIEGPLFDGLLVLFSLAIRQYFCFKLSYGPSAFYSQEPNKFISDLNISYCKGFLTMKVKQRHGKNEMILFMQTCAFCLLIYSQDPIKLTSEGIFSSLGWEAGRGIFSCFRKNICHLLLLE